MSRFYYYETSSTVRRFFETGFPLREVCSPDQFYRIVARVVNEQKAGSLRRDSQQAITDV